MKLGHYFRMLFLRHLLQMIIDFLRGLIEQVMVISLERFTERLAKLSNPVTTPPVRRLEPAADRLKAARLGT